MRGMIRYAFTIVVSLCMAMLAAQRAFGQVIREAPNGDLFVADSRFDMVRVLRVSRGRATPIRNQVFARGVKQPFGIAFYPLGSNPRWVYVAGREGVIRFPYRRGDLKARGRPEKIVAGLPTVHHYARAVSPDGHRLYLSVGFAPAQIVESGLQNCGSMTVQPATGELSCIVSEHEEMGDVVQQSALLQLAAFAGESGRNLYIANCAACHQASGEGLPGVFPPLKGSGVVNKDDASKHIDVVLNGMRGDRAGGVVYAAPMPPFAGRLSDADIAEIIDYERRSWGNHGAPVTAAQVNAERIRAK